MTTVKDKAARRIKAVPLEIDSTMYWCKEHRSWSSRLVEVTGRNGTVAMMLAEQLKNRPYDGFLPVEVWDNLALESYSRGATDPRGHWFPTQDLEKVMVVKHEGDTVWRCGNLQECGRWWPDKASAVACYDSH